MRESSMVVVVLLLAGVLATAAPSTARASGSDQLVRAEESMGDPLLAWALHWRGQAERNLRGLNRALACFSLRPLCLPELCTRDSGDLGRAYRSIARAYASKVRSLRWRMAHPRGTSVRRWRPLVSWYWPPAAVERVLRIIARESHGDPRAVNRSSGASGLLQFIPEHWRGKWNPLDPDQNIAYGYRLWRESGWSPWALTH